MHQLAQLKSILDDYAICALSIFLVQIRLATMIFVFYLGTLSVYRVRTGPGKPGKSWNFIMAFSRTGKSWKMATAPENFWQSDKLNKNMECTEGSKEN